MPPSLPYLRYLPGSACRRLPVWTSAPPACCCCRRIYLGSSTMSHLPTSTVLLPGRSAAGCVTAMPTRLPTTAVLLTSVACLPQDSRDGYQVRKPPPPAHRLRCRYECWIATLTPATWCCLRAMPRHCACWAWISTLCHHLAACELALLLPAHAARFLAEQLPSRLLTLPYRLQRNNEHCLPTRRDTFSCWVPRTAAFRHPRLPGLCTAALGITTGSFAGATVNIAAVVPLERTCC